MKISEIIAPEFTSAFDKLLRCEALSRQDRRKLKQIAMPVLEAQRRFQRNHSKFLRDYSERDENNQPVEIPIGNGMSKYKIRTDVEAEFNEKMDELRSEEVDLPNVCLNAETVAQTAKLTPMDELALDAILVDLESVNNLISIKE